MAKKDVKVSFSGRTISVDKKKVQPKLNDDTVDWSGPQQYTIVMPGGQQIPATQQGGQWLASAGPWNALQNIKYDITAPNHDTLDPDIEVVP